MPRLHSSIWLGAGMLVFAVLLAEYLIPSWVITPENVRILVLSPDFWPYIVAGLLALGGVTLLAQYFFLTRRISEVPLAEANTGGTLRIVLIAVLMVIYYLMLTPLGMILSSFIAYMAFMAIIGLPRKTASLIIAVLLPIALYVFFDHMAGVPIPQPDFLRLP